MKGHPSQGRSPRRRSLHTTQRSAGGSPIRQSSYRSSQGRYRVQQDAQPLRSVSVSDVRNAARYRAKRSSSGRFKVAGIVVVILLLVVGIGGFALANSGTFTIKQVTASGVTHISEDEMTELAAIPEGATLLNVDTNGIASRLTSNPWVQSVVVERVFPDTINLNVTERTISAVVSITVDETNTTERWLLSSDGMWLMELPDQDSEEGEAISDEIYEEAEQALEITDIPYGSSPEVGEYCDNSNVENALAIIDGMTTELADQVTTVSAASSTSTTLTLENGVEIVLGDSEDIRDKERVCLELLSKYEGEISYINVSVVNEPVWRSL